MDRFTETIFYNDLVQCRVEFAVQYKAGGIVDEGNQVDLLFGTIFADWQVGTVLDVGMPESVAVPPLETPCRHAGIRVHPHLSCAVALIGQLLLQGAAFDLSFLDQTFPLHDLNDLGDATAGYLAAQQDSLV